ncbi:unnamed protein product [Meloidogyne enterolobii]|uniref:Uncharacterized protein n=1 Tax=Meloidogyne enterolobii TaxID=390850 RepID=A0ACB0Y068_MELEN
MKNKIPSSWTSLLIDGTHCPSCGHNCLDSNEVYRENSKQVALILLLVLKKSNKIIRKPAQTQKS